MGAQSILLASVYVREWEGRWVKQTHVLYHGVCIRPYMHLCANNDNTSRTLWVFSDGDIEAESSARDGGHGVGHT